MHHFWQLYYYFVDPGNQMSMQFPKGGSRFIGLVMSTLGSIFLGGLLISTITNTVERRVDKYRKGESFYKLRDHVVIIGSDQLVQGIVRQLSEREDVGHIVVLTSGDAEAMRSALSSVVPDKKKMKKIIVNHGSRDSEAHLRKICVAQASEVYMVGDESEFDDIENFHDSLNVWSLQIIAKLCEEAGRRRLPCHVSFNYKTTYQVFQYANLPKSLTERIDFHPFNFYAKWAQTVFVTGKSYVDGIEYPPLDYEPITSRESDKYVHLIVIGLSQMGQAIALQAAHIAHFPNYKRRKTRITLIDRNMKEEMNEFKQKCGELFELCHSTYIDIPDSASEAKPREVHSHINMEEYGHLATEPDDPDFIDLEWTFINGDDNNPHVRKLLEEYAADPDAIVTVAVCLNITHMSLRSAMWLPTVYYEKNIPILVQQRKTASIANALAGTKLDDEERANLLHKNLRPFGMVYDCFDVGQHAQAKYYKRIHASYSHFFNDGFVPMQIDDAKLDELWKKVRTSKRWSNIFAAMSIPTKLRCVGMTVDQIKTNRIENEHLPFTDDQITTLAEMEHNRWNVEELLLGYRPVTREEQAQIEADISLKDVFKKRRIHYDIRTYDDLRENASGLMASDYDKIIIRSLPLIVND